MTRTTSNVAKRSPPQKRDSPVTRSKRQVVKSVVSSAAQNHSSSQVGVSKCKRRSRAKAKKAKTNRGRWSPDECKAFLVGLKEHGKGKWSRIAKDIPTRDTVQVKTHAQVVLKRMGKGDDIFELLNTSTEEHITNDNEIDYDTDLSDMDGDKENVILKETPVTVVPSHIPDACDLPPLYLPIAPRQSPISNSFSYEKTPAHPKLSLHPNIRSSHAYEGYEYSESVDHEYGFSSWDPYHRHQSAQSIPYITEFSTPSAKAPTPAGKAYDSSSYALTPRAICTNFSPSSNAKVDATMAFTHNASIDIDHNNSNDSIITSNSKKNLLSTRFGSMETESRSRDDEDDKSVMAAQILVEMASPISASRSRTPSRLGVNGCVMMPSSSCFV